MQYSCQPRFKVKFLFRSLILYMHIKEHVISRHFELTLHFLAWPKPATLLFYSVYCQMILLVNRESLGWERYNWSYPLSIFLIPFPPRPATLLILFCLIPGVFTCQGRGWDRGECYRRYIIKYKCSTIICVFILSCYVLQINV